MLGARGFILFRRISSLRTCFENPCCNASVLGHLNTRRILIRKLHMPAHINYAARLTSRLITGVRSDLLYKRCLSCSSRHVHFNNKDTNKNTSNREMGENGKFYRPQTSSSKDPGKGGSKVLYYLKRFRFIAEVFWNGCKNLFYDVRYALKIRRKLGLYFQRDYSKLTRDEVRHLHQTKDDIAKTFPVTLLFMIPFIGYTAPILAYFYPKQLLSQQFWHPDQHKAFILEEYEKRSQYYLPLIKEVAVTCKETKSKELYKLCLHVINGNHPTNDELLQFKDVFSHCRDFSLRNVPRYHLVKLCKCWLIPTGWYLPRRYLMNALRRRISRLHLDDTLILQEGVIIMTPKGIAKAAHMRGLDESSLNLSSVILWLDEWVHISSKVSGDDVSFLAHCAAFKAANFEKFVIGNGILPNQCEIK